MTDQDTLGMGENAVLELVEKIRAKVEKGELDPKRLAIAEYMTNPDAPFPVSADKISSFFDSMRRDGIAAINRQAKAAQKLEHG